MNTIKAKNYSLVAEEGTAGATIKPGSFVAVTAAGAVSLAGADFTGPKVVAVEDEFQGRDIDDDYVSGEKVQLWTPYPGDIVYAIASTAVAADALVAHAANGQVVTASTEKDVIGKALEAAGQTGDRILVKIK